MIRRGFLGEIFMIEKDKSGSSSIGRVSAFQAEGCGFETRLPLQKKERSC